MKTITLNTKEIDNKNIAVIYEVVKAEDGKFITLTRWAKEDKAKEEVAFLNKLNNTDSYFCSLAFLHE